MNPWLFPPALLKRLFDDLGAIADAARRLPALEQQVLDRIEREALTRADTVIAELGALRAEMTKLEQVREGIAPLDGDMRAVRVSVDDLEPLLRDVVERLEALRKDLAPLGDLAEKIPGI